MIRNVSWKTEGRSRRPDLPEGASFRVVQDHGDGTVTVEVDASALPHTLKSDVWERCTDAEALELRDMLETARAATNGAEVKLWGLWADGRYIDHSHTAFGVLRSRFVQRFGPARADVLLAPSER